MFYEEKFINGSLMFRTIPNGKWTSKMTSAAMTANEVMALSLEERLEVMGYFCSHCGTDDLPCFCMRDE